MTTPSLLKDFHATATLRLSASEIAAMTGFHPFRRLPLLLYKLVYQGSSGNQLLQLDAQLLNLRLVDEQDVWLELASKAGPKVTKALHDVLQVPTGKVKLDSIRQAHDLKDKVSAQAQKSGKLSKQELNILKEASRSTIYTGFGTVNEEDALDLCEARYGWEIRERNLEVLEWPFIRAEVVQTDEQGDNQLSIPTVIPLESAMPKTSPRHLIEAKNAAAALHDSKRQKFQDPIIIELLDDDDTLCDTVQEVETIENPKLVGPPVLVGKNDQILAETSPNIMDEITDDTTNNISDPQQRSLDPKAANGTMGCHGLNESEQSKKQEKSAPVECACVSNSCIEKDSLAVATSILQGKGKRCGKSRPEPLFVIRGSVDGIRDELVPCERIGDEVEDDNSWILNRVIVECKHRMNRIQHAPPLYEQIQTTAYCLMYEVVEADIVQVMRTEIMDNDVKSRKNQENLKQVDDAVENTPSILQYLSKTTATEKKLEASVPSNNTKKLKTSLQVDRIRLDDPIMQHRKNWVEVILPRLRSFAEAVYAIRKDDHKRYQLLVAVSDPTDQKLTVGWRILHQQCPWLENCDTAFHRDEHNG